jgi:predicted RNase H-like nuclease
MTKHIGVSWASNGWFGVVLRDDGSFETDHFPTVWSLWKVHSDAARIAITVPIGLPAESKRACDVAAKRRLGRRGQSLFHAPLREAVYQQNIEAAKRLNERAGYSIQNQTWSIVPRIREVDEFLDANPGARDRFLETHPELCFHSLNGRNPVAKKTTAEGINRRKALLADEHSSAMTIHEESRDRYLTPDHASFLTAEADILDALVAAVTARRPSGERSRLPERSDPPRDARGLPMQMVYPSDVTQARLTTLAESERS